MGLRRIYIANGFSLIEVIIAIALFAIVASFALPMNLDAYRGYNFRNEQNLLVSLLQKARSQAMSNINQSPHGVYLDASSGSYTLFQGDDFSRRDPVFDLVFLGNKTFGLTGATSVVFTQLSGTTTEASITLDDGIHKVATISLNSEGQINVR